MHTFIKKRHFYAKVREKHCQKCIFLLSFFHSKYQKLYFIIFTDILFQFHKFQTLNMIFLKYLAHLWELWMVSISNRDGKFETQLNRQYGGSEWEISGKIVFLPIYASYSNNFCIKVKLWSWRYFPILYLLSKNKFWLS